LQQRTAQTKRALPHFEGELAQAGE
jgi:hypothetical protein